MPTVFTCSKMVVPCRSVNCKKRVSTKTNRNKHERSKGPQDTLRSIPFNASKQTFFYYFVQLFGCFIVDVLTTKLIDCFSKDSANGILLRGNPKKTGTV